MTRARAEPRVETDREESIRISKRPAAMRAYPAVITPLGPEDGGGFAATFPDLPGCRSGGETPEEALHNALDAIDSWIEMAEELGHAIPDRRRGARAAG